VVAATDSNTDLEFAYLGTVGGTLTTLGARRTQVYGANERDYFVGLSGITPAATAQQGSLTDHKLAYYRSVSSKPTAGLADASRAFWRAQLGV
jgi:hypothetical protein